MKLRTWTTLLVVLVGLKILGAPAAYFVARPEEGYVRPEVEAAPGVEGCPDADARPEVPHEVSLLLLVVYGAGAWLLLAGGRRDRRAVYLGVSFLLIAGLYTGRLLSGFLDSSGAVLPVGVRVLQACAPDAFLPFYLWLFARSFPRLPGSRGRWRLVDAGVTTAAVVGVGLFAANLARPVVAEQGGAFLGLFERAEGVLFTFPVVLLVAGALAVVVANTRRAAAGERRRAQVFVAGLVAGLAPILLQVLAEGLIKPYECFSYRPAVRSALEVFIFSCVASVPFTTAYAVLVHKVLDVRLIARRALQYALARYTTLALALVPFAALCTYLVRHRDHTLTQLFTGSRLGVLLAATTLGVLAMRYRRPVLDAVDRRFFREQYDARKLLTLLVEQIRSSSHPAALADLVAHGIGRALHLETVAVLVADPETGLQKDPPGKVRPLDPASALGSLVAAASEPLEVDLEAPRTPIRHLPEEDRHWVADGGFHLLVPMISSDGQLLGVIALGGKKSGLPFLREDRQLLATIAASAAPTLELQLLRHRPAAEEAAPAAELPTTAPARECLQCGRLFLPAIETCSRCENGLEVASVPFVVPGKFRFECRLGSGGMGVVYLAVDLALGRPVAVKTLRRMSPEDAMRLRREARTAAAVSHPNLAFVFGVETWRGTPMLILEYLERGTLSQHLSKKSMDSMETVELGIAMAGALERLHAADILHRDVKPSNIGYARDGTPKLMDFGIARARFDPRGEVTTGAGGDGSLHPTLIWGHQEVTASSSQRLVGTLFYLPPEAFDGARPGPTFDLWALCLVLFECLAARRVFDGDDVRGVIRAIRQAGVPDVRRYRPDCPRVLTDFLARNLSRLGAQRAATAADLRRQLEEVRRQLVA